MANSKIEWTDATWNPVTGCTKVSVGCQHCYAERMAKRLAGRCGYPADHPFRVTMHEGRLDQPFHWRNPRMVFVCSMGDLFHKDVSDTFIDQVFAALALAPRHTYQILTKRADRMAEYTANLTARRVIDAADSLWGDEAGTFIANYLGGCSDPVEVSDGNPCDGTKPRWPIPCVWLGVSVENQAAADERIPHLLACPAAVRFVSCEPLLGRVDLTEVGRAGRGVNINALSGRITTFQHKARTPSECSLGVQITDSPAIDWVIAGGESGPNARPMHPEWARSLRDQCAAAGVPFFFKQWGGANKKEAGRLLEGRTWDQMPGDDA